MDAWVVKSAEAAAHGLRGKRGKGSAAARTVHMHRTTHREYAHTYIRTCTETHTHIHISVFSVTSCAFTLALTLTHTYKHTYLAHDGEGGGGGVEQPNRVCVVVRAAHHLTTWAGAELWNGVMDVDEGQG